MDVGLSATCSSAYQEDVEMADAPPAPATQHQTDIIVETVEQTVIRMLNDEMSSQPGSWMAASSRLRDHLGQELMQQIVEGDPNNGEPNEIRLLSTLDGLIKLLEGGLQLGDITVSPAPTLSAAESDVEVDVEEDDEDENGGVPLLAQHEALPSVHDPISTDTEHPMRRVCYSTPQVVCKNHATGTCVGNPENYDPISHKWLKVFTGQTKRYGGKAHDIEAKRKGTAKQRKLCSECYVFSQRNRQNEMPG